MWLCGGVLAEQAQEPNPLEAYLIFPTYYGDGLSLLSNTGVGQMAIAQCSFSWDFSGACVHFAVCRSFWQNQTETAITIRIYQGWRDGSVIKNICCSSRGTEFNSQYPHDGSQPSIISVPRDLTPFSNLHGYQVCT